MKTPSNNEIATTYNLWIEYVDPDGHYTREMFDAEPVQEKIAFIQECFGQEVA